MHSWICPRVGQIWFENPMRHFFRKSGSWFTYNPAILLNNLASKGGPSKQHVGSCPAVVIKCVLTIGNLFYFRRFCRISDLLLFSSSEFIASNSSNQVLLLLIIYQMTRLINFNSSKMAILTHYIYLLSSTNLKFRGMEMLR